MEQLCREYPQIHYHRHAANVGPARNLSWALAKPSTDLVARLDSDDRMEPRYVEVLAGLMQAYPQAGYAHCDVWELDENNRQTRLRRLTRSFSYEGPDEALKSNARGFRTAANCILFRAKALEEADYYLPHPTWTFSEDWDLALRMAINGWGNVYAAKTLSNYRQWDDPQGARASRKFQEVSTTTEIYRQTLIPAYEKRGWSIAPLERNMRHKAVRFVDTLDSPRFSDEDRVRYKQLLRDLGDSPSLSFAILLAELGLNPMIRSWDRKRSRFKDWAKRAIRSGRSARATRNAAV
jgi:hypothetical protein